MVDYKAIKIKQNFSDYHVALQSFKILGSSLFKINSIISNVTLTQIIVFCLYFQMIIYPLILCTENFK